MNTKSNTCRRTAITVPGDLLDDVDRAAGERGESRSRFITTVLRVALRARGDSDITRRLNALFSDEKIDLEQRKMAAEMDAIGTRWSDERW